MSQPRPALGSTRLKWAWTLTWLRLAAAPLWVAGFLWGYPNAPLFWLIVAMAIEASDVADGWLARGAESALGAVVDPLADSLFRISVLLSLAWVGHFSLWWVLPVLYRDALVAGVETVASILGKPCFSDRREIWKSRVVGSCTLGLLALYGVNWPTITLEVILLGTLSLYCLVDGALLLKVQWHRLFAS